jgi:hypothetical protein
MRDDEKNSITCLAEVTWHGDDSLSVPAEYWFWHGFRGGPRRRASGPVVDHEQRVLILIWRGFCGRI